MLVVSLTLNVVLAVGFALALVFIERMRRQIARLRRRPHAVPAHQ